MISLFSWFKGGPDPLERDRARMQKLDESQQFLIDAAVAINDVAGALTEQIRRRYEAETRFEATSNIIEDALIICDMLGAIQYANEAASREFGTGLVGRQIASLFESAETIASPAHLFDLLQDSAVMGNVASTLRARAHDGGSFMINPKLERLDWEDKTSSMMILVRRASDTHIRDLMDLSFDAILVVRSEHIVAANPSVQRVFGYDSASLLGQPLSNLFPKERSERIVGNEEQHVVGTHDDGRMLNLKFSAVQILWDASTARLITVRPIDDQDVPDSYELKTDNGIDMIVCFNGSGKITFANSTFAKAYKKTRKELVSSNMRDVLDEREYEILQVNMNAMSPEKPTLRVQLQHERDGEPCAIHDWIWHAVFDKNGNIVEYQRTGRDISSVVSNIITAGYF